MLQAGVHGREKARNRRVHGLPNPETTRLDGEGGLEPRMGGKGAVEELLQRGLECVVIIDEQTSPPVRWGAPQKVDEARSR